MNTTASVPPSVAAATVELPRDIEGSWNAVAAMTAQMHELAAAQEWVQLMELAAVRHQRFVDHFGLFPVGPANAEFYRERMHDLLQGEEHLQQLALEARKEVMRAASVSNQNHRAVGAYLNTAVG